MQYQRLRLDRLGTLPQNLIEKILSLLSIRDAIRTSVLSKKWRYHWTSIPELDFNDNMFQASSDSKHLKKYKFVSAIFHVLMLRRAPLLHFRLVSYSTKMHSEIDQIIAYLSMSNSLKSFTLTMFQYKLPSSLFSLQQLENLNLKWCCYEPPLTFNGFGMLKTLILTQVDITIKMLQSLLSSCPLLETFVLNGCHGGDFMEEEKFSFVELLECLPSVMHLEMSEYYLTPLIAGGISPKLSSSLVHLKIINLEIWQMLQNELLLLLYLIRSSPNLEKIHITICGEEELRLKEVSVVFASLQDYSSYNLNHLEYLEIEGFRYEMEFVKFIMARSPVLKKVHLKLHYDVSDDEELKMFRHLMRQPLPRASPLAKFIVER